MLQVVFKVFLVAVFGTSYLSPLHTFSALPTSIFLALAVNAQATGDDCSGSVGRYSYSLQALATVLKGAIQSSTDPAGHTYYYAPCASLQSEMPQCMGEGDSDPTPAVCQRDMRQPIKQYHDLGSSKKVTWSPRSTGDDTGFTLLFYGGSQDRATNIEFICDPNAGVGAFMTKDPSENPVHLYHLKWATAYACPTFNTACCHYDKPGTTPIPGMPGTKRDTQSTCILAENPCPSTLGKYAYSGNTTVLSCDQCGKPQRSCCFYSEPSDMDTVITSCVSRSQCPSEFSYDGSSWKLVGGTRVDDCNDCYFA